MVYMLTKSEQLLLLEMLLKKEITKKEQKIFKSIKFYKVMSNLIKNNLVECEKINKNGNKSYFLSYPNGWALANLLAYNKNTPEKYRKIAKEFRVLI